MNNIYLFYIFGMYFRYMTCIVLHLAKINFRYRRLLHVQFILCYLYSSLNYYCYNLLAFHSCHVIYSVTRRQFVFTPREGEWRYVLGSYRSYTRYISYKLTNSIYKQSFTNTYNLQTTNILWSGVILLASRHADSRTNWEI